MNRSCLTSTGVMLAIGEQMLCGGDVLTHRESGQKFEFMRKISDDRIRVRDAGGYIYEKNPREFEFQT